MGAGKVEGANNQDWNHTGNKNVCMVTRQTLATVDARHYLEDGGWHPLECTKRGRGLST